MSYHISQSDPSILSTEDLLAEMASFKELAVEVVKRYSLILSELKRRRKSHAFMRHPVLSFFKEISEDTLHPEAALTLGNKALIKAVSGLPKELQLSLSAGDPVPVAVLSNLGEIKSDDISIYRMSPDVVKRAIAPDRIRPVHEQSDILRAEAKTLQKIGSITVLKEEQVLKIGNQKVRPEDLAAPLLALGYKIRLARDREEA